MPANILREQLVPHARITQVREDGSDIVIHYENKPNAKFNLHSILFALDKRGWCVQHTPNAHFNGGMLKISKKPPKKTVRALLSFVN